MYSMPLASHNKGGGGGGGGGGGSAAQTVRTYGYYTSSLEITIMSHLTKISLPKSIKLELIL